MRKNLAIYALVLVAVLGTSMSLHAQESPPAPPLSPLIMSGLVAAFDTSVPSTLLKTDGSAAAVGEPVATINCAIGSAYQLTQTTSASQWIRATGSILPPASSVGYNLNSLPLNMVSGSIVIATAARTSYAQNWTNRTVFSTENGHGSGVTAFNSVEKIYSGVRYGNAWTDDAVNLKAYCYGPSSTVVYNSYGKITLPPNYYTGTETLTKLLAQQSNGGWGFDAPVRAIYVFNRVLTDAEIDSIRLYLGVINHSTIVSVVGDSIVQGFTAANCWVSRVRDSIAANVVNAGASGDTMALRVNQASGLSNGAYSAGKTNIMVLAMGTNDLASNVTASTLQANFTTFISARKSFAADWIIIPATILPRTAGFSGGATASSFETQRQLFNTWVRANFTCVADYGDLSIALGDGIHPEDAGHATIATCVLSAIAGTLAQASAPTLSNLLLSNGTLSPAFSTACTSYTANVPNTTASITVTPTVTDSATTVMVNGRAVASGAASATISLSLGINTITTVVTAQDGTTTKTYTVTLIRAISPVSTLSGLILSSGALSPTFSSTTMSYTASVPNTTAFITVTPTVTDPKATVTVNGNPVISSSSSAAIPLSFGSNTITTVVAAQDRLTHETYKVTVTRAAGVFNSYSSWIAYFSGLSDTTPSGYAVHDGIPNLLKYVLNGNPGVASATILPTVTKVAGNFIFSFSRLAVSAQDTTQIFQYSTDMSHWTKVMITSPTDSKVALGVANSYGEQKVTVTIPIGNSASIFGKLNVSSTTAGLSGFSAWIGNYPGLADTAPLGNPAQDGIPNLLKYVLNGNPGLASTAILPRVSKLASSSIFTFSRRAESAQDTTQIFQYSTDLSHWTNVMITSPTDAKVALGAADANGVQIVTVTIPAGNNASLFGRLSVTDSVPYASGFSAWIANYPSLTGPNALSTANPTHDGLTNLVKYALGLDPTVAHGDLGTLSGKTLSFTKGTIASGDSNVSYTIPRVSG